MSICRHVGFAASLAVSLLVASAAPGIALAQGDSGPSKAERAAARDAYDKGTASFERGDYVKALDSFVKANALIPSVQAMYWIAQAQDKLGHTDAAIEAYEAITSRADFSKLSADKAAVVNARLAALKAQAAPPIEAAPVPATAPPSDAEQALPPAAPAPPAAAGVPTAPITEPPPPPVDSSSDVLPQKNTAELGVLGGLLFVSRQHNLVQRGHIHRDFAEPSGQIGVRAAFFAEKVFGVEAEWVHGFGKESDATDVERGSAHFDSVRGHLIGQLPTSRVVPFALLGAGLLHANSPQNGADTDFLLEGGLGVKVMATKLLVPRLDVRADLTQKKGGGFTDGVAIHPEILLGLSFVLGR